MSDQALSKTRIALSSRVFDLTVSRFIQDGYRWQEGVAYWLGQSRDDQSVIDDIILADDISGIRRHGYGAEIPIKSTGAIGEIVHRKKKILLAQVHSHPGEAYHSDTDDMNPISHRIGFLSVVVPCFGFGVHNLTDCKIYEYFGRGIWDELDDSAVRRRFVMTGE